MLRMHAKDCSAGMIIHLVGDIDARTSALLTHNIDEYLRQNPTHIILDFSDVILLTSAGLRALFDLYIQTKTSARLMFCSLNQPHIELVSLVGMASFIDIFPDPKMASLSIDKKVSDDKTTKDLLRIFQKGK